MFRLRLYVTMLAVCLASHAASATTVAIIKFVRHPALDATEAGIVGALESARATNPRLRDLRIERYEAQKNPQVAKQLAESVSRDDVSLIIAIATPAAQAVARTPSTIPLLYAAVADPEGAGILASGRATGIRNAGDRVVADALTFMRAAFPKSKTLGTLYNPSEQNSVYVKEILKRLAPRHGFSLEEETVTDPTQVATAAEVLSQKVDIIYSANDNTVNAGVAAVVAVTRAKRLPFVLGDLSTLSSGATAAVGLEYGQMGRDVGTMAVRLLTGTPLRALPPRDCPAPTVWANARSLKLLNIRLPKAAAARVTKYLE